jgi:hypothetical protein
VLSYIYELPFGRNKKFLAHGKLVNELVGGWSVSGIQRYESGQPIAFACATGVPAYADCIRFDQVPGQSLYSSTWNSGFNPITDSAFNPAALSDPNSAANLAARGTYAFGTITRVDGAVRMRPYLSEDFNLLKRTRITQRSDVLLQANILNAFNRHIWNRPGDLNPYDLTPAARNVSKI